MQLLVEKYKLNSATAENSALYETGARIGPGLLKKDLGGAGANLFVSAGVNVASIVVRLEKPWFGDKIEMCGGKITQVVDAKMPESRSIFRLLEVGASLTIIDDDSAYSFTANE